MKSSPAPPTHVARNKPRAAAPVRTNQKPAPPPAETALPPNASSGLENDHNSSNVDVEDDGHSIYVRNLPFDTTPTQLEEVFKSFGDVKHEGIQVRSNKQQGFCFGFVEFETSSGKQSALEASPITIGDRQVVLEEKKTNSRGGNNGGGRGRYFGGRGSFRSESFKGGRGGGVGGGRGWYGRGEFSGRPNPRNGGEGYQRVPQNGGGGRGGGGGGRGGRGGPRGGGGNNGGGRGRYFGGRGSFRNESFKGGRGGGGGVGGGGRGWYGRGEFSGRPNSRNGGEGYQRVPQNGGGERGGGGRGGPRGGGVSS
ncbi:hypothetical protein F2Q70_00000465 [Brassica cretica]|uniref:RRM domain-containing protein n=1 Tax=Brassica cretica TaxID=69181 RepID=A0A8S9IQ48_BRACR|nr:hypothetical protein F2Q70_00000465 [Brassica cretica]